ncbi:MAG TPA: hypothetical protein VK176_00885 [Phycisphaerales bacterium]|nr:hypothetical protein [Phycisphaerales bacterium]
MHREFGHGARRHALISMAGLGIDVHTDAEIAHAKDGVASAGECRNTDDLNDHAWVHLLQVMVKPSSSSVGVVVTVEAGLIPWKERILDEQTGITVSIWKGERWQPTLFQAPTNIVLKSRKKLWKIAFSRGRVVDRLTRHEARHHRVRGWLNIGDETVDRIVHTRVVLGFLLHGKVPRSRRRILTDRRDEHAGDRVVAEVLAG